MDRTIIYNELCYRIAQAFEGVRLEDGVSLHQARAIDDYESPDQQIAARSFDGEVDWHDVSEEKLTKFHDVHPFLDAAGFRFYLPAFMTIVLRHLTSLDWNVDSFIYSLILHPDQREFHASQIEKFKILTQTQSEVVADFFRFLAGVPEFERDSSEALAGYWNRFDTF